jgi:thiol-disulfide isomerase/thioredoxin
VRKRLFILIILASLVPVTRAQEIPVLSFGQLAPMLQTKSDTVYMVNFWATWCLPCVEEMPYLLKYAADKKNSKFRLILVSLDMPNQLESRVIPFVKRLNISEKVVLLDDPDANKWIDRVSTDWSGALPGTLLFSNDFRQFHSDVLDYEKIKALVEPRLKR